MLKAGSADETDSDEHEGLDGIDSDEFSEEIESREFEGVDNFNSEGFEGSVMESEDSKRLDESN